MTGARVTEMPVNHHARRFGSSKYGMDRIFKVFSDIFSMNLIIRFSSMPLKGFSLCALPFVLLSLFFSGLAALGYGLGWTDGKPLFFLFAAALCGTAVVHLIILGILGELVLGTSDLPHTRLSEVTKRIIHCPSEKNGVT